MKLLRHSLACCAVALFGLAVAGNLVADDPLSSDDVVKNFIAHVESLDSIDAATRGEITALVQEMTADEYSQMEAVTAGLARIYPEYENAIVATQSDDADQAMAALRPHIDSDDLFLAADSSFFLARTLMNQENHEAAIPILERLSGELANYSLHAGPAIYFSGVAQAALLENQRALQSFADFLELYPDAPERLRVAAWRQVQMIRSIEEGGMEDVLQRMDYSHRRLRLENTDETTQDQQNKIVTMLQKMILEQEKKECSSSSSKKNCEGQQEAQSPGEKDGQAENQGKSTAGGSSNNPNGVVRRTFDDGPASPWSRLRERSRDAANNAIKQKLPARYRNVVEKYYETISGNEKDGNELP